jgi:hypothetical protein
VEEYSLYAWPGPVRPARPARWSAAALEIQLTSYDAMPELES